MLASVESDDHLAILRLQGQEVTPGQGPGSGGRRRWHNRLQHGSYGRSPTQGSDGKPQATAEGRGHHAVILSAEWCSRQRVRLLAKPSGQIRIEPGAMPCAIKQYQLSRWQQVRWVVCPQMSALGQKRTSRACARDVCFTPKSRHRTAKPGMSANSQKRTLPLCS